MDDDALGIGLFVLDLELHSDLQDFDSDTPATLNHVVPVSRPPSGDRPTEPRFATISHEEINDLKVQRHSKNTRNATENAKRTFEAYLREKMVHVNDDKNVLNFETKAELDSVLTTFYVEARKKDGDFYKKTALQALRGGLHRYYSDLKKWNLMKDTEFEASTQAFKAQCANLKRIGKGTIEHHPDISEEDLKKVYASGVFNTNSASGLLKKVYFEIMLYVCRRGRENLRLLTKKHFRVETDGSGRRYVYQSLDEVTKNHKEDEGKYGGRIYEIKGDPNDPVASFEKYVQHLHPDEEAFFQHPNQKATAEDKIWFGPSPLSHNAIGDMMPQISKEAKLSRRYTNHCTRDTCVTLLDDYDARHIMSVTAHKSEASIRSYSRRTKDVKKREMADTISAACGFSPNENPPPAKKHSLSPLKDLDNIENLDSIVDDYSGNDDATGCTQNYGINMNMTKQATSLAPVLNNCYVNINYNIHNN